MKLTKEIAQKTAHLARLHFEEQDEDRMIQDLQKVVDWVDQLQEVDTTGVEPLTGMSFEENQFRSDEVDEASTKLDVFKNAPKHDSSHFQVPKVIEQK